MATVQVTLIEEPTIYAVDGKHILHVSHCPPSDVRHSYSYVDEHNESHHGASYEDVVAAIRAARGKYAELTLASGGDMDPPDDIHVGADALGT